MKLAISLLLIQIASAAPVPAPTPSATGRRRYTIVLRDGTRYQARGPYTTKAALALIALANGQLVSVRIDAIDTERTRTANLAPQAPPTVAPSPAPPKARLVFTEEDIPSVPVPDPRSLAAGRQTFSGRGPSVTSPFPLEAGLSLFELRYFGERWFSVDLFDSSGTLVTPIFVRSQVFYASKRVSIPRSGLYTIKVDADAPWSGAVTPR
ncbi:MAG: hypothetical protein IPL90_14490 [Holophagales bacterium]|nr:hypothetical protein [Holophagales bacterium]